MPLIVILVFAAVFSIVALLVSAARRPNTSAQIAAALESALKPGRKPAKEEVADVRKNFLLSSIPWLNRLLGRMNLALEFRNMLNQADLNWTPGRLLLKSVAVLVAAAVATNLRTHSLTASLIVGLLAGSAPIIYVLRKRRGRLTKIQEKLPEALDLMVSALRAGHSMGGALSAASKETPGPLGREFRLCFEEQNFGIDLRTATENLLSRVPVADLRIVTTAMLIHKESGGNLAEVLEKTAHVIRERFRLQQQIRVHTALGRLTGSILMLLPVIIGAILYVASPAYIGLLFSRPFGNKLLMAAGTMNLIGFFVIRRIVNIRI